ncbi:ParA family protein [Acidithiobacillus sp.]
MKSVTFFNNKGGVGKSTFSHYMGYMLEQKRQNVLFVDLDPQCNLTSHICTETEIEQIWGSANRSIYHAVEPLISAAGDVNDISPYKVDGRNIYLIPGDLMLSEFESFLAESWVQVLAGQERGYRAHSAIFRIIKKIALSLDINYVIIDVGPNFGSLNRAVMLGCDNFFVPMIPDLFSLRGSQNLGRVLAGWIDHYQSSKSRYSGSDFDIPNGCPKFSGYVTQQFNIYRQTEAQAWKRWGDMIPRYIKDYVVEPLSTVKWCNEKLASEITDLQLGQFKNYHSLIPMAQAALKPIFELTSKDGVIGAHHDYVRMCKSEFSEMADKFMRIVHPD